MVWFRKEFTRVYADTLKDNFVGFDPLFPDAFEKLRSEFEAELINPDLANLLRIEGELIKFFPDNVVVSKAWSVLDRFERVVPNETRERYFKFVPELTADDWKKPAFVRDQIASMLDVIHSNYLLNEGRELLICRMRRALMLILAILFIVIWFPSISTGLMPIEHYQRGVARLAESWAFGLLAIVGAIGAIMSMLRRLQTTVSHEMMAGDGITELMTLQDGKTSICSSLLSGAVFALIIYFFIASGALDAVIPEALRSIIPQFIEPPYWRYDETSPARALSLDDLVAPLHLKSLPDFFKMLLFAFLAGFAERLVPDALDRFARRLGEEKK